MLLEPIPPFWKISTVPVHWGGGVVELAHSCNQTWYKIFYSLPTVFSPNNNHCSIIPLLTPCIVWRGKTHINPQCSVISTQLCSDAVHGSRASTRLCTHSVCSADIGLQRKATVKMRINRLSEGSDKQKPYGVTLTTALITAYATMNAVSGTLVSNGARPSQRDVSWDASWRLQLRWLNGQTVGGCSIEKGHHSEMLLHLRWSWP